MFYAHHQPYPKWLYHRDGRAVIANDEAEHAALGEEWAETPAAFADEPDPARHEAVTVAEPEPTAAKTKKARK